MSDAHLEEALLKKQPKIMSLPHAIFVDSFLLARKKLGDLSGWWTDEKRATAQKIIQKEPLS